jgi:iron-sulfur cluster assembly protein
MEFTGEIVSFSPNAIKQVLKLKAKEDAHKKLRVGYKNGGCSGLTYIFEFDSQQPTDIVSKIQDFEIIIDSQHAAKLLGLKVDYEGGLNNRGFIFINPNAQTTCGCGTSFG